MLVTNDLPEKIRIVMGLGNPGRRYAKNRHNFGQFVIDRMAFLNKEKFDKGRGVFIYCRIGFGTNEIYLAKSTTYMNESGRAAIAMLSQFGLEPRNLMVVCDDCNLPLGKMRYRPDGSDGGHNGLSSIIETLESKEFPRLRLGIGLPPEGRPLEDYVLEKFEPNEAKVVEEVVDQAVVLIEKLAVEKRMSSLTLTV